MDASSLPRLARCRKHEPVHNPENIGVENVWSWRALITDKTRPDVADHATSAGIMSSGSPEG